ncbi:MAG: double zinc ribbon domain-containing protein [Pseudomonadota bacterium]
MVPLGGSCMLLAQRALKLIYPSQCIGCGAAVERDFALCGACWRDTPFLHGVTCDGCAAPLPGGEPGEVALCDECLKAPRAWEKGRAALAYDGRARQLVMTLKRQERADIFRAAGHWMAGRACDVIFEDTVLVPVPLHWTRLLQRRYNQAALLARAVGREVERPTSLDALRRVRRTRALHKQSYASRYEILADAIRPASKGRSLVGRAVLLIDDVMTSGATLTAAAEAAHEAGARRVDVLTLARAARAL